MDTSLVNLIIRIAETKEIPPVYRINALITINLLSYTKKHLKQMLKLDVTQTVLKLTSERRDKENELRQMATFSLVSFSFSKLSIEKLL